MIKHPYIQSVRNRNLHILLQLQVNGLLNHKNPKFVDAGIGLGHALWDFYNESQRIFLDFDWFGIEIDKSLIKTLQESWEMWNSDTAPPLTLIEEDIMEHDFSDYSVIYTYTPFKKINENRKFYKKVTQDMKVGSIFIEHANEGNGQFNCADSALNDVKGLKKIALNNIGEFNTGTHYVWQKEIPQFI
jgi:hypothetical protein